MTLHVSHIVKRSSTEFDSEVDEVIPVSHLSASSLFSLIRSKMAPGLVLLLEDESGLRLVVDGGKLFGKIG